MERCYVEGVASGAASPPRSGLSVDLRLAGRRCMVTGASSGIGRGVAKVLADEGVRLALVARTRGPLETLCDEIIAAGGAAPEIVLGDVTAPGGPEAIARQASTAIGDIDMLVNSVGASRRATLDSDDAFWDEAMAINFTTARKMTHALLPTIRASGAGRVVSMSGAVALNRLSASGAGKAALQSWSRGLAGELALEGVTVNIISPGIVQSGQTAHVLPTEEARQALFRDVIPIGRLGEPEEVGALTAFLLSPHAAYITGAVIPIDGGYLRPSF